MTQENKDDTFSKKDKSFLKKRIYSSIYSYKRKRLALGFAIAASATIAVLLVSTSLFRIKNSDSDIERFAETQSKKSGNQDVQLFLNDNQNIDISDNNAKITYSDSGEEVSIGGKNRIEQQPNSSADIVFNTLIVPFGKRSEIVLSDGSKVWLNSGSKLIFPAKFASEKREVYLEGEAIFEVSHNKKTPFFVKSKNHEIEVLGTVFNVSNYIDDSAICTVLKSGSVQINYASNQLFKSKESIKIIPGNMLTFNKKNQDIKQTNVDVEKYFSWRDGVFIFKNDPLKNIIKKISRYYNVEILITDTAKANGTFSGHLDVNSDLESVLETIKETAAFEYKFTEDRKIIIN